MHLQAHRSTSSKIAWSRSFLCTTLKSTRESGLQLVKSQSMPLSAQRYESHACKTITMYIQYIYACPCSPPSIPVQILNEMLSDPTGADTRVLSSILSMLSLDNCSDLTVQNLTVLTEMLIKTVSNRVIKRKFVEFLDRLNERGAEALSEEQIAEVHTAMAKHRDEREVDVGSIMGGSATPRTTRRTARKKRPSAVASRAPAKGLDLEDEDSSEEDADEYEDEDDEVINEGEQQLDLEPEEAPASEVVEPGTPATDSGEADKPESEDDESESEEEVYELEELLETRKNGRRNEYLVKWKGFGAENNTWEPTGNLPAAIVKVRRSDPTRVLHK